MSRKFKVGCTLSYHVETPSTVLLNIEAAKLPQQHVLSEKLVITPDAELERHVMPESGNRYVRFQAKEGKLVVEYEAVVELDVQRDDATDVPEVPGGELPFEVLPHLYPSRFCQSDRLVLNAKNTFDALPPGHARITAICNWIYEQIEYQRGTSNEHTSAVDTLIDRAGVCRDFAHLGIALCRALGVPARFVSAYAWKLSPPDFHAVFEAYLGGRWYLFDATRQAALDGLVRIGVGRDASEVAFADFYGEVQPSDMSVRIERLDEDAAYEPTVDAITTSAA